jgi:hypothetical protein
MTRHQRSLRAEALLDDIAAIDRLLAGTPSSHKPCRIREGTLSIKALTRRLSIADEMGYEEGYRETLRTMRTEKEAELLELASPGEVSR